MVFEETNNTYCFGIGRKLDTIYSAKISTIIGIYRLEIENDVVKNNILFLKLPMKRESMNPNFEGDILNENIPCTTTNSGNLCHLYHQCRINDQHSWQKN